VDKVTQAIEALKAAEVAIREMVNPISVSFDKWGRREVQVETLRDLEQIPGEVRYEAFQAKDYPQFKAQAVKECNGYKFFCVLEELPKEDEYDAIPFRDRFYPLPRRSKIWECAECGQQYQYSVEMTVPTMPCVCGGTFWLMKEAQA